MTPISFGAREDITGFLQLARTLTALGEGVFLLQLTVGGVKLGKRQEQKMQRIQATCGGNGVSWPV